MLIKICGITLLEDALASVEAGATALGFNFWRPGKRYVAPAHAAGIAARVPQGVRKVGVFVDEDPTMVLGIAAEVGLDVLQFHGAESAGYLQCFPGKYAKWKAIRVDAGWDPASLMQYEGMEAFLLDTAGATPGGTGLTFDWTLAVAAKQYGPVILAGGLNPANVADAVRAARPWGVDVASGVEISPGVKDHQLVRDFVMRAKEQA